jgi:hypothetical protein
LAARVRDERWLCCESEGLSSNSNRWRPWRALVVIEFDDEAPALKFERYLESGSGRECARRHFRQTVPAMEINDTAISLTPKKKNEAEIAIAYESISSMTYGRRSRTRKMAPTWGRAEDHFLTIQYKSAGGIGEFVEMELGKNTAPRVLAALEARSGKKIEHVSGS